MHAFSYWMNARGGATAPYPTLDAVEPWGAPSVEDDPLQIDLLPVYKRKQQQKSADNKMDRSKSPLSPKSKRPEDRRSPAKPVSQADRRHRRVPMHPTPQFAGRSTSPRASPVNGQSASQSDSAEKVATVEGAQSRMHPHPNTRLYGNYAPREEDSDVRFEAYEGSLAGERSLPSLPGPHGDDPAPPRPPLLEDRSLPSLPTPPNTGRTLVVIAERPPPSTVRPGAKAAPAAYSPLSADFMGAPAAAAAPPRPASVPREVRVKVTEKQDKVTRKPLAQRGAGPGPPSEAQQRLGDSAEILAPAPAAHSHAGAAAAEEAGPRAAPAPAGSAATARQAPRSHGLPPAAARAETHRSPGPASADPAFLPPLRGSSSTPANSHGPQTPAPASASSPPPSTPNLYDMVFNNAEPAGPAGLPQGATHGLNLGEAPLRPASDAGPVAAAAARAAAAQAGGSPGGRADDDEDPAAKQRSRLWYTAMFSDKVPSGRQEVAFLAHWLQTEMERMEKEGERRAEQLGSTEESYTLGRKLDYEQMWETHRVFSQCAYEVCRQVSTHCMERGRLQAFLWRQLSDKMLFLIENNRFLQEKCLKLDDMKAELDQRFDERCHDTVQQNKMLKEDSLELRRKYGQQAEVIDALRSEMSQMSKEIQKVEAPVHDVKALQHRILTEEKEKIELSDRCKKIEAMAVESREELTAMLNFANSQAASLALAKEQMKSLTPRIRRDFGNMEKQLDARQLKLMSDALDNGIAHEEVIRLMTDPVYSKYVQYFGCIEKTDDMNRTKLVAMLRSGEDEELERLVEKPLLVQMAKMLHHGLEPETIAGIFLGEDPNGGDIKPLKALIGTLDPDSPDVLLLEESLLNASISSKDRYQTVAQRAAELEEENRELHHRLKQYVDQEKKAQEAKLKKKQAKKSVKRTTSIDKFFEVEWKDVFVGLGTGNDIPKFLKTNSKVRNRHLSKRDTEKMVKEIWADKALMDLGKDMPMPLMDYIFVFLQKKVGIHTAIVEWGYNLLYSLHKHSYDADCDLFLRILMGEVHEEVYQDQIKLQVDISDMCRMLDDAASGKKPTGKIPKQEFVTAIEAFFPDKTQERMKAILAAVEEDFAGDTHIQYAKLFEEDREYNQGAFAEEVREQQLTERLEYLSELEAAMYEQADGDMLCDVEGLSQAFREVDPNISKASLTLYLTRCYSANPEEVGAKKVDVRTCMTNMKQGVVKKESKKFSNAVAAAAAFSKPGSSFGKLASALGGSPSKQKSSAGTSSQMAAALDAVRGNWIKALTK